MSSMRRNTCTSQSPRISFSNVSGALRTRISLWSLRFSLSKVHARAAPDSELHGLHQHVDDSETTGAAALAREADTPRLRCADPADLGTRESVWPIRSRHEYAIGVAVIEMAPGDTTVGSTPESLVPAGARQGFFVCRIFMVVCAP